MQLTNNRITKLLWIATEKGGMTLVSIVTFFVYAKLLTPEQFGYAIFALAVGQGIAMIFANLFEDALIQQSAPSTKHYDTAFWGGLIFSLLSCSLVAIWLLSTQSNRVLTELIAFSLLIIVFVGMSSIYVANARMEGDFKLLAKRSVIARLIGAACGITMAFKGFGPLSVVIQAVLIEVISFFYLAVRRPQRIGFDVGITEFKELSAIGWLLCLRRLSWDGTTRGLPLILGTVAGPAAVGLFGFAWRTVEMPRSAISSGLMSYALPAFSRKKDDKEELQELFIGMTRYTALLVVPLFVGLAATAPTLIPLIFGDKWLEAIVPVQVMSLIGLVSLLRVYAPSLFTALARPNVSLTSDIVSTVSALVCTLILADDFGVYAAVFGLITRSIISVPFSVMGINKVLKLNSFTQLSPVVVPCVASIGMAVAVQMLGYVMSQSTSWLLLTYQITGGAIVYFSLVLMLMPNVKTHWGLFINR
ncbi:oligosaccharide flippase family protein [Vibrio maritimus]|uniref:oligosaccharide flippase family protein n=1 Tax=Vibrio maritimus TaxID=990268 RepID=UPI0040695364